MARFRKIDPRIWKDEKFSQLSPEEKLIAFYCLTAQTNRVGLFNFSPALAAEDLGMTTETFRKGFEKVCQVFQWRFDSTFRVLFIPTWFKYNVPENPNVLKAFLSDLHDLPQTPLLSEFYSVAQHFDGAFLKTFAEGYPKPSPNQEKENENENENENEIVQIGEIAEPISPRTPRRANSAKPKAELTPEALIELYNTTTPPEHPKVRDLTPGRLLKAKKYLAIFPTQAFWTQAFGAVARSAFLQGHRNGEGHTGFKGNFDWFLTRGRDGTENAVKAAEGQYADSANVNGYSPLDATRKAFGQLDRDGQLEIRTRALHQLIQTGKRPPGTPVLETLDGDWWPAIHEVMQGEGAKV